MNSIILFKQLLVLLGLMATGFIAYKTKILDDHAYKKLSSLVVWILNPALMINSVIGGTFDAASRIVLENIILVGVFYAFLFLIGFVFITIFRIRGKDRYLYRLVMLFPNVGFMGIPLVKEVLGSEYVVLVAFYTVGFNLLGYTYGIHLARRYGDSDGEFSPKKLLSPGTIGSLCAIIIFALNIDFPEPLISFTDYLGTASITLSMVIIGISLATVDWKRGFSNKIYYIFLVADMIVVPMILVFISKLMPFDPVVIGVFQIMACMPVASTTCMFTTEYADDGSECAKLIALTTVATVITAPVVIWLSSFI